MVEIIESPGSGPPAVTGFYDPATCTVSYVMADHGAGCCAVIDPVLDYDPVGGRTSTRSADALCAFVEAKGYRADWVLETHIHADHLTAAVYVHERLGGRLGIGASCPRVQETFARIYGTRADFTPDGSQFDRLFSEGETFAVGEVEVRVMATPGHTPDGVTYVAGDAAFIGDTLFMPDYGTARCDFPGGDAATLYRSIRRILSLAPETRLFVCHDYPLETRPGTRIEATVAEQRARNVHAREGTGESEFVTRRTARDRELALPALIIPAVQVNIRAGALPPPAANGTRYLRIPLNIF